ncbi:SprT family protein [Lactobacillus sp. UCMA15818]|uniref:SprT family protein n=1 Tax=Lactobacillaceae TaxID=33958 RepID=UPI0025B19E6F|nr:SprT family protein [Lactobacillus sp. UCMA15818]MDN2452672.1 SprT family protein [Lactobacillus sp. UCMA15818]
MNNTSLQELVEKISLDSFGQSFDYNATFNSRLRTTGGRYDLRTHNIDINPKMLIEHDEETLRGVIKHELCHYHLHLDNKGYQHRDSDFKRLLTEVAGLKFAPLSIPTHRYGYVCIECNQLYVRKRRINLGKYVCSKCHGKLKLQKEIVYK